jgi:Fucose permease
MAGFLLGAAGMFAVTYSTQAILPQLGRTFNVSPSEAGLTISIVVLALAMGAWIWGPVSDRYGRKRSIVLASALLVAPTVGRRSRRASASCSRSARSRVSACRGS